MNTKEELQKTINDMTDDTRGILAADESLPTIAKSFLEVNLKSTGENRCDYRQLILSTPDLNKYISSVILFEEALEQNSNEGMPLVELARRQDVVIGIKADIGNGPLPGAFGDSVTFGLDDLAQRLGGYKAKGVRFAKWREVYSLTNKNPTHVGINTNAEILARYAKTCQEIGIVPIVEPEVLMIGNHDIDRCAEVTENVLHSVFHSLHMHRVHLEHMLLKPNMIVPGKALRTATPEEVASMTLKVLRRTVPVAVPSINFLSGGQAPEEATQNLNAINQMRGNSPWQLSSSFGRALLKPALRTWKGKAENTLVAQQALLECAMLNSLARQGKYKPKQ